MKLLIGIKTKYVGEGFADQNATDHIVVVAKGESEVHRISTAVKKFKKVLAKLPTEKVTEKEKSQGYCEVMQWYRQSDKKIALHKKFGREICKIAYDYRILMITEAELI